MLPFLKSRALDAVDFLSLDIEGHEDPIEELTKFMGSFTGFFRFLS